MDNYQNTSLSNLDSITNLENKPMKFINKTANLFEIEELTDNQTLNGDLKSKGQSSNESEFYKLMNLDEDGNASDYYTEEPCVGDSEFCYMDREEYIQMLNEYIFPQPYEWVLIVTHAIVFVIGLIGNALVCIAVYRNHSMRTVTNYFIVNLAVADFMVILICLPPTVLWDVTKTWFFGTAMCKIVLYFQVSLFFLRF